MVHFNGWGDYPNPAGYTNSKRLHAGMSRFIAAHRLGRDQRGAK